MRGMASLQLEGSGTTVFGRKLPRTRIIWMTAVVLAIIGAFVASVEDARNPPSRSQISRTCRPTA
jgi:hypothetical protein